MTPKNIYRHSGLAVTELSAVLALAIWGPNSIVCHVASSPLIITPSRCTGTFVDACLACNQNYSVPVPCFLAAGPSLSPGSFLKKCFASLL